MVRPSILVLAAMFVAGVAQADYRSGVRAWGQGDFAAAAAGFLPAAQAGDAEAQYMMGRLYSLGDGVPSDFVQAWVWFDRAARQGHGLAAEARDSLGAILNAGQRSQAVALVAPPPAMPPAIASPTQVARLPARSTMLVPRNVPPARLVAPGPSDEGRLAALGDLPARVLFVQQALRRGGYYFGPLDGALGGVTRQAIRDYQRDSGMPPTGRLTAQLVEALGGADQQQAAR